MVIHDRLHLGDIRLVVGGKRFEIARSYRVCKQCWMRHRQNRRDVILSISRNALKRVKQMAIVEGLNILPELRQIAHTAPVGEIEHANLADVLLCRV